MNCWEPLRAEALQRSEQLQARKFEKSSDWAISSQADAKAPEGSTTRASKLTPKAINLYTAGKTLRQVGQELDVPYKTIGRWLHKAGIKLRKPGQNAKSAALTKELLHNLYIEQDRSAEWIAAIYGVEAKTVRDALRANGIEVRRTNKGRKFDPKMHEEHARQLRGKYVGSKNPNWRGSSVTKYNRDRASFQSKEWSKAVRGRDGKCMHCGTTHKLHAHHITPWRQNAALRYDVSNGITLCALCHQKEHGKEFPDWVTRKAPRAQTTLLG